MLSVVSFLTYLCISELILITPYSHSINIRKWSVMSLIKIPLVVRLFMTFVKMLSIRITVYLVIIVGLLIRGYRPRLYIVSIKCVVPKWLSCFLCQH